MSKIFEKTGLTYEVRVRTPPFTLVGWISIPFIRVLRFGERILVPLHHETLVTNESRESQVARMHIKDVAVELQAIGYATDTDNPLSAMMVLVVEPRDVERLKKAKNFRENKS